MTAAPTIGQRLRLALLAAVFAPGMQCPPAETEQAAEILSAPEVRALDGGVASCGHALAMSGYDWAACDRKAGERCYDLRRSHQNCGACGVACTDSQECTRDEFLSSVAYQCRTCADGLLACKEAGDGRTRCLDVQSSNDHCGACNQKCDSAHQVCRDGKCIPRDALHTANVQLTLYMNGLARWDRREKTNLAASFRFVNDIKDASVDGTTTLCITVRYKGGPPSPGVLTALAPVAGDVRAAKNCDPGATLSIAELVGKEPIELTFDVPAEDAESGWLDFEVALGAERRVRPPTQHFRCSTRLANRPTDCAP